MHPVRSEAVDIPTPDGVADAHLAHPDDGVARPGVLVIQDGFGLRPGLRSLADRIAAQGYTVLLPNAFYRHGRAPVVDLPDHIDPVQRPEIVARIMPMVRELTPELLRADVGAFLSWMAASPLVAGDAIGVTGYCMGARMAVLVAEMFPHQVAAVAGFHGGPLVTDAPDSPHRGVGRITGELYFAHAGEDAHMTPEQVAAFEQALTDAGVRHRTEVYAGAQHGYTQADTAMYDRDAAERHYRELFALFDRNLR